MRHTAPMVSQTFSSRRIPEDDLLIIFDSYLVQKKKKKVFIICIQPPGRREIWLGETPLMDIGLYTVMFATYVFQGRAVVDVKAVGEVDENGYFFNPKKRKSPSSITHRF